MSESYQTEFGRRFEIIKESKEMDIYRSLGALRSSFQVFEGNSTELIKLLEPLEDPKEALFEYTNTDKRDNLLKETERLLHNFLASAKSLVDHTRVIVNKLYPKEHEFKAEYQRKLNQDLANNMVQKFVQNLRNYTQHYTLPILALEINFLSEPNDLNMTVQVDVEILKQWDNWGSSRAYLDSLEDGLPIIALAKTYHILIHDFYVWLSKRQSEIHQADLDNLNKMQ